MTSRQLSFSIDSILSNDPGYSQESMCRQWSETYDEEAERLPSECESPREEDVPVVTDTGSRLGGPLEHLLMQLNELREREVNWMVAASGVAMGPFVEAASLRYIPVPPNTSLMASANAASPSSQPPPLMHPFAMSDEASMAVASGAVGPLQLQYPQAHASASSFLPALALCAAGLGVGVGGLPLPLPLGFGVNVLRRAVFSDEQRRRLECHFLKHRYINKHERGKLAAELGLRDSQVKVWFQNRRQKNRQKEREGCEHIGPPPQLSQAGAQSARNSSGPLGLYGEHRTNVTPTPPPLTPVEHSELSEPLESHQSPANDVAFLFPNRD